MHTIHYMYYILYIMSRQIFFHRYISKTKYYKNSTMLVKLILKGIFHKVIFTLEQYRYNVIVSKRLNEVNCPSVSMLFVPYPLTQHQPEKAIIKTVVKCPFFGLFRAREEAQRDPIENPSFFVYVALLLLCCMQEAG